LTGAALVQRYSIQQTGVSGLPRVIAQLPSREIAVGTDRGLFLYDGQRWRAFPGHSGVSSLVTLPDGRVFIGSGSEVYELRPDGRGGYGSRSRTEGLLRNQPDSRIFSLSRLGPVVYGLDGMRLIAVSDEGPPRIFALPTWGAALFEFKGELYVRTAYAEEPIYRFDPRAESFHRADHLLPPTSPETLVAHTRDEAGVMWFATQSGALFGTDGRTSHAFPVDLREGGSPVQVQALQALPNGGLAVVTIERGLVLLDRHGGLIERAAAADPEGSPKRIYGLGLDQEGGLWVGSALEIVRIDGRMRSTIFGERSGVVGEVWAIARHEGRLHVATDSGLFAENPRKTEGVTTFSPLPNLPPIRSLAESPDGLWIGAETLLLLGTDGRLRDFGETTRAPNPIILSRTHSDQLVVGVRDGLRVLRRVDGEWEVAGPVPGVSRRVFNMAETAAGDLWASYGSGAIVRVRWRGDEFEVREFGEQDGIPNRWIHLSTRGNDVFLGSENGTLAWNEATGRFVPTTSLVYYGGGEPFGFDPVFSNGDEAWIWPQTTVGTLVPRPEREVLAAIAVATGHVRARSRSVYYDTDGVVWVGLAAGLLRHTPDPAGPRPPSAGVQLRRLIDLRTGETIAGGLSHDRTIELPARQNSVRVEAALPRYFGDRFQQFQIELRGKGRGGLPPYETRSTRDFTHLAPGRYQLVIAARDGAGRMTSPLTLGLIVRAPAYATGWAYLAYALVGVGAIFGLVRWRLVRFRRQAETLQSAVEMRTGEIWRQSALLAEEKQLFASLAAAAPVGIWRGDGKGRVVFTNAALEQICGRAHEVIMREGWLQSVHPDDRSHAGALMHSALAEGQVRSVELRFVRPDGEVRWVIAGLAPVRASTEGVAWLVGTALDLTERREVERRMMRAQRLESIGTLTGGIAHDLNNALVPIIAGASLIEDELSPENRAVLTDIERSARRAAAMVRQLLAFARGMDGERVRLNLVPLLRELGRIVHRTFPKNITLKHDFGEASGWVQGDPTQLHQVLLNLCVNARDAMPDGGTLSVELETRKVEAAQDAFQEPIPPGEYRVVTVTDTGTGMTQEVLEHIFDPFFTTKGPDRGTGLGLSTTLGIIRGHSGYIAVETKLGVGTRFSVYLPAMHAAVEAPPEPTSTDAKPNGPAATVTLVVDDEVVVRSVVTRGLQRLGIQCLEAPDGAEGLRVWKDHRGEIGLIVADLSMPVMDGVSFIREVRPLARTLPIIVITGNLTEEHRRDLQLLQVDRILQKPFRFEELASAIREVLH
jgi:two-component system, cell cycle sensor histidine kinase and response regulator CckA